MKVLISIFIGLLVVGCGKKEPVNTDDGNNVPEKPARKNVEKETPSKSDDKSSTSVEPVKELTTKSVAGEYIVPRQDGSEGRFTLLPDGRSKADNTGIKQRWKLVENQVHMFYGDPTDPSNNSLGVDVQIAIVESNGDLTWIAQVKDGKRKEAPKGKAVTWKRIK
tara:strand:+ start:122 stop:616 length:495 start_codon:yes stop_codon:yes gene_type:complete